MPAFHTGTVPNPSCSMYDQLPLDGLREAAEAGPSVCISAPMETWISIWPSKDHCSYSGVKQWKENILLSFSINSIFQIK